MKANKSIIVKKVKKGHGGGHHGGAWKVAYADFVTAMMAFFLLMWLLNMTSEEKRARLSAYFKYFSIYDSGGTSWMGKSSAIFGESGENTQKVFADKREQSVENTATDAELNNIEKSLNKDIAEELGDIKDQIIVDKVDEGIRIQMIDKEGSLMFERGNNTLTPKAREVLKVLSKDISKLPNKVIIEGHTDSLSYAGSQYSNWELSTERASSARRELEATGFDPKRIIRVAGYADTDPLIKDNPQDPRNRRISITLSGPQNSGSKKSTAKAVEVKSNEKQLREASKELVSILDNGVPAKKEDRATIDIVKGIYNNSNGNKNGNGNGNGNTNITQDEWPALRPIKKSSPVMPEENKASLNRKNDYDSIIKEGQSTLKNGSKKSTDKDQSKRDEKKGKEPPVTKIEGKSPSVIKELSEPIIIKEKLFSITPNGK